MTTHVQQTLPFPWQGGPQCSLQLLIKPWICTVHQVPITAEWTEAVWNTWPALGIEPQALNIDGLANFMNYVLQILLGLQNLMNYGLQI